jgi:hypothetical protein
MAPRPVQRMDDYPIGDWSFILEHKTREMYEHDYQIINSTPGVWQYLKNHPTGSPVILNDFPDVISKSWNKHTAETYRQSMAVMKTLAKMGWEDFVFLMRED